MVLFSPGLCFSVYLPANNTSCAPIASILDEVLLHCQNSSTLEAGHELLQTLSSNAKFSQVLDSTDMLKASLEDMGFGGLWRSCTFSNAHEQDVHCFSLTERLIEVCFLSFFAEARAECRINAIANDCLQLIII